MAFTETLDSVHIYWLGHKAFLDLPHPSVCFLSCCFSLFLYSRDLILYPQIRHTFFPPLNFLHAVPSTWNFSLSYLLWDLQNSVKVHLISLIFPWIIINKNKWLPILYCHINRINIYLCTHCTILHFFNLYVSFLLDCQLWVQGEKNWIFKLLASNWHKAGHPYKWGILFTVKTKWYAWNGIAHFLINNKQDQFIKCCKCFYPQPGTFSLYSLCKWI